MHVLPVEILTKIPPAVSREIFPYILYFINQSSWIRMNHIQSFEHKYRSKSIYRQLETRGLTLFFSAERSGAGAPVFSCELRAGFLNNIGGGLW